MKKRFFKTALSLALVISMAMPSSYFAVQAEESVVYEYEEAAVVSPVSNSWTVVAENAAPSGDGPAAWAFDNVAASHWHSNYDSSSATDENKYGGNLTWGTVSEIPEFKDAESTRTWIGGEFEEAINLGKMEYTGRTNKSANWYGQYALYTANVTEGEVTAEDFELAASGTNTGFSKVTITLEAPKTATHFRFVAFTANPTGNNFVSASEIDVFEAVATDTTPAFGGAIVGNDKQWTDSRLSEVKKIEKSSETFNAWKNDTVTSEIALYAANAGYEDVTVTAGDFVDTEGNKLAAEAVFVRSTKAYNGGYVGYGSNNTSANYPAETATNRSESADIIWKADPVDMNANTVQPVWVEIDVPADAPAGSYTGNITVEAEGAEALTFTYTVEVADAVLPETTEFVDTFDMMQWHHPYSSAEYYGVDPFGEEHLAILEDMMLLYKEAGGNAIAGTIMEESWNAQTYSKNPVHYPSMVKWTKNSDGTFSYDYSHLDAWLTLCTEMGLGEKITLYGLAPWHNSFKYWENGSLTTLSFSAAGTATYNAMWTDFLTKLIDHLEEKGWFDNVYLGIDERGVSESVFALVESVKNDEGKCLKTAADIDNITRHWNVAQNVTDLNVGDTAAYHNRAAFEELVEIRDAKGFKTTLYSCTEHQPGNFSLSAPVESYWTVLNAGMMNADGFNRWAYDAWVEDPLNDTTHYGFEPGDCFVIFPDEKDAADPQAFSSVRFARMAEGVRDVNKLKQIEAEIPALAEEVDAVFDNIQYALTTSRSYLGDTAAAELSAETAAFKADLNELTEKYIALKSGGTYDVESVTIDEGEELTVEFGKTAQLHATLAPENLINTNVVWTSSNQYVVSVNDQGEVQGLQPGSAMITATSEEDDTKSDSIKVIVEAAVIDSAKQVAYYSFNDVEGNVLDDEWGSHDGTIAASATTAAGKSGNALSVNTAGEGAAAADYTDLDQTSWTVSYWVKTTAPFTGEISVLEESAKGISTSLKMAVDREAGFRVGDGPGDVLTYKYSFVKDNWYHLTWVQDTSNGLSMYVNGEFVANNVWTKNNPTRMKAPVEVIGGTGFTGLIDEVKIFNAPLTESEIASLLLVPGINGVESPLELNIEDTHQLAAYVISENADKTLTYESSDESIATVDENGLVTAVGRGSATITIKNEAGGFEAQLTVKVTVETSIINELTRYVLPEKYQSDVDGPYPAGHARRYLGQPDMVQTETGRLITVYPTGHGHGPLVMKISEDQGETWTEKTNIPESWAKSQETPTLYSLQVDDGEGGTFERLVLVCACPNWDLNLGGWQMSYSDDNGDTWTEFTDHWQTLNGNKHYTIVAMASLVQLKDEDGNPKQEWMGVYHDGSFVNYKSILTFDENGAAQWTEPEPYLAEYRQIESSHQICEVGLFRSPDGKRIVGLGRNQSHAGPATMFYSDDEGKTWSEPVELPGSLAGERHKALYDPISGRLVITFREIIYDRNGNGVWEGGSDWICGEWVAWVGTYEQLMNLQQGEYMLILDEDFSGNFYSGDTGYTGMAVLEDGTFVLHSYGHWDESSASVSNVRTDLCWIRQAKFSLSEVEEDIMNGEGGEIETPENPADDSRDIPVEAMTATAGSVYTPEGQTADKAIDQSTMTIWHTDWKNDKTSRDNHWIAFELDEVYTVDGLRYLNRQDGASGCFLEVKIQTSTDGENWTDLDADGTFANKTTWQKISFDPVATKYVRIKVEDATTDSTGAKFAAAAEIRLTGERGGTVVPPAVDKEALEEAIKTAKEYDQSLYTPETAEALANAIATAEALVTSDEATQTQVNEAVEALQKAIEDLEEKEEEKQEVCEVFTDVPHGAWYEGYVQYVYDNGLMAGNNGLFNPTKDVTRAQLVTTLYRLAGEPDVTDRKALTDFTDVADGLYYTDAVCWAYNIGVGTGNDGKFNPTGNLTRQQMAAFLYRFAGEMGYDTTQSADYSDMLNADQVSEYAETAVSWAVGAGLISGSEVTNADGTTSYDLKPRGNTTRAQLAAILQRFCEGNEL